MTNDLDKCLKDYSDDEVFDYLRDRRNKNIVAQIELMGTIYEIAQELKQFPISDNSRFMSGRTHSLIEFIKGYTLELDGLLKDINKG